MQWSHLPRTVPGVNACSLSAQDARSVSLVQGGPLFTVRPRSRWVLSLRRAGWASFNLQSNMQLFRINPRSNRPPFGVNPRSNGSSKGYVYISFILPGQTTISHSAPLPHAQYITVHIAWMDCIPISHHQPLDSAQGGSPSYPMRMRCESGIPNANNSPHIQSPPHCLD